LNEWTKVLIKLTWNRHIWRWLRSSFKIKLYNYLTFSQGVT
jgi:hypothetical protein